MLLLAGTATDRRRHAATLGWMRRRKEWDNYLSAQGHESVLSAFVRIVPELDGETYWRLLRDAWERADSFSPRELALTLLRIYPEHRHAMMTEAERADLASMPSAFDVYRGVGNRQYLRGFSWTTDQARAKWFARQFLDRPLAAAVRLGHGFDPGHQADPVVAHGTVRRTDVIAYLGGRQEQEIVALPEHVSIHLQSAP
jgi:hypothetical protein